MRRNSFLSTNKQDGPRVETHPVYKLAKEAKKSDAMVAMLHCGRKSGDHAEFSTAYVYKVRSEYHSIGYGASSLCVEEAYPMANHPLPGEAPVADPNHFKDTGYISLENCPQPEIHTVLQGVRLPGDQADIMEEIVLQDPRQVEWSRWQSKPKIYTPLT